MMDLYNHTSVCCSEVVMKAYSTSFSLGTKMLHQKFRTPIYAIYGFVRLADEIVDTFHQHDKRKLLQQFRADTDMALKERISLNPVIHAFQETVHQYGIDYKLIDAFLVSMEMDLEQVQYNQPKYNEYIYGSAEVVGLMCLRVFCENDKYLYAKLVPAAKKLGAAFQKVNFLRDMQSDYVERGRMYFPGVNFTAFNPQVKQEIEADIERDFRAAKEGIKQLPSGARLGVYVAYRYYWSLFCKIRSASVQHVMDERIRVSSPIKCYLFLQSYLQNTLGII